MYYKKSIEQIREEFKLDEDGLTTREVNLRRKKYGMNILPKKENDSVLKLFFNEFKDPMLILLVITIIVSLLIGEIVDALIIFCIVLIDAIMGTYQENKANHTAEALANLVSTKVKVLRDGEERYVSAEELTIGDYVILESGDKVSADMRIIESRNLMVDESILTGESVQVSKNSEVIDKDGIIISEQSNMLFSGTTVVTGRAKAIVIGIGYKTEIGKIADSINNFDEEKSPLTIRVEKLSKHLSIMVLIVAFLVAILLYTSGFSHQEVFLSVVALAVSAMPEGLPLALTMALTIAANRMAKKNVIVKKLNAAESLGSCTVIASDKTGTLTVNEQTAKKILLPNNESFDISGVGYNIEGTVSGYNINFAEEIALLGVINNESRFDEEHAVGDSIDIAFKVLGRKLNVKSDEINILETIPYESENKYSAVFYEKDGETFCTVKGSLEVVKSFCNDINLVRGKLDSDILENQNEELAKEGYRVIALANGKVKKQDKYNKNDIVNLKFMGMVGFIDPVREEAIISIEKCKSASIKVLMITGDHPLTAYSIAKDLKLTNDFNQVTTGTELDEEFLKGEKIFDEFIKNKLVFARVTPLQKLKIVESLKRQGEFVAVTGDGVNDAPALKVANIGVAMGSGTDIARETADMIIVDDNFKSIVDGIKEGRVAYANIRKIILFLVSCGLAEITFFCLSIAIGLPMPLLAIQLLWLNVVTDGVQDFALSFEKEEDDILKEKPRNPKESIFNWSLLRQIISSGIYIGLIVYLIWYLLIDKVNMDVSNARGYVMALMVFIQNIHVFNCRSETKSAFKIPLKSNILIILGVLFSISLQIMVMEIPLFADILRVESVPFINLVILFAISLSVLLFMEIYKKERKMKKNP